MARNTSSARGCQPPHFALIEEATGNVLKRFPIEPIGDRMYSTQEERLRAEYHIDDPESGLVLRFSGLDQ